jgi:hypothetical protein
LLRVAWGPVDSTLRPFPRQILFVSPPLEIWWECPDDQRPVENIAAGRAGSGQGGGGEGREFDNDEDPASHIGHIFVPYESL